MRFRVVEANGLEATGARVALTVGSDVRWRHVGWAYGYQASNDPAVHFGLGDATAIDAVTVHWLDGTAEAFEDVEPGRTHTLRRGQGRQAGAATRP